MMLFSGDFIFISERLRQSNPPKKACCFTYSHEECPNRYSGCSRSRLSMKLFSYSLRLGFFQGRLCCAARTTCLSLGRSSSSAVVKGVQ